MNRSDFSLVIANPSLLKDSDINNLNSITDEFPYFQAARVLHLKGLKNNESFMYNKSLKITAAYTTDRSILFDFITSELIKNDNEELKDVNINGFIDLSDSPISNLNDYNEETEDEDIILEIGKPFEFKKDESYSFNQWLQLTKIKPIDRDDKKNYSKDKREKNIETINKFIEKNPKISPLKSKEPIIDLSETNSIEPESLMTETLARIYLEQKNYAKAIQSYKILILKYPEKSALFADQIKAVEKLQEKIKKS
jgi:hypothetical protein